MKLPLAVVTATAVFMMATFWSYMDLMEPNSCGLIAMYPMYHEMAHFTSKSSRMGGKYKLYQYGEWVVHNWKGLDPNSDVARIRPNSVPVLFIPGNAGSYNQARSVAAYCASRENASNPNTPQFDFFSVHFKEDLTAFHGRTLLDQAQYTNDAVKYILALYSGQENPPQSVIVVAHSMGGMVARTLVTLPNYRKDSVQLILTLSTPHTVPPLAFDHDVTAVYTRVNHHWRLAAGNYSLVSIAGGHSDSMVPSDYTYIESLVPPSHGFSVFTYSLPEVWTPVDHLAVVWCAPLRVKIGEALIDAVDPKSPYRLKPQVAMMTALKNHLQDPFERAANTHTVGRSMESESFKPIEQGAWVRSNNPQQSVATLSQTNTTFIDPYLIPRHMGTGGSGDNDLSGGYFSKSQLWTVPHENTQASYFLTASDNPTMMMAPPISHKLSPSRSTIYPLGKSPFHEIDLIGTTSSLIAYKMEILQDTLDCSVTVRQSVTGQGHPLESRYHVHSESRLVTLLTHTMGPHVPFVANSDNHIRLSVYSECESSNLRIRVYIDWFTSLATLVMRYRTILAMFPTALIMLSLFVQLTFISSQSGLLTSLQTLQCVNKMLPVISLGLFISHVVLCFEPVRREFRVLQIAHYSALEAMGMQQNEFFLGTSSIFAGLILCSIFPFVSMGLCYLVLGLAQLFAQLGQAARSMLGRSQEVPPKITPKSTLNITYVTVALVLCIIPFQVAHIATTLWLLFIAGARQTKIPWKTNHEENEKESNVKNVDRTTLDLAKFKQTLACLYLCVCIVDAPVAIVWARNMSLRWSIAFSSWRNLITVFPIVIYVLHLSNRNNKMRVPCHGLTKHSLWLGALVILITGFQHTWIIHYVLDVQIILMLVFH